MKMKVSEAVQVLSPYIEGQELNLRKAYKKAALASHPDRQEGPSQTMMVVNAAYEKLKALDDLELKRLFGKSEGTRCSVRDDDPQNCELYSSPLPSFYSRADEISRIFNIQEELSIEQLYECRHKTVYLSASKMKVTSWNGALAITDLENALRHRRDCLKVVISQESFCDLMVSDIAELGQLLQVKTMPALFKVLIERLGDETETSIATGEGKLTVRVTSESGMRTFSPFNLVNLKPLTEKPKKWTVPHLVRLLANGQYRQFHQAFYYTDDYAHDAASNYGRSMLSGMRVVADLVNERYQERRVYEHEGQLSFGDHCNDLKRLVVVINNRFLTESVVDVLGIEQRAQLH